MTGTHSEATMSNHGNRLRAGVPGTVALREAREAFRANEAWDAIAADYDRTNTPTQMRLAEEGLRRAALRADMRFLDVAAGSGALAIPAARIGAKVTAIDRSAAMLEHLRRRALAEGLAVDTRVMDGHALAFDDGAFDMAGSQFGVMLFPDMPKALTEMARVVKAGGRVLMHAYGDPHRIDFLGFLEKAVQAVRPGFDGPPADPAPLEFQLAQPETMQQAMEAAGLREVTVQTFIETTRFSSGDELWDWLVSSNPLVEHVLGGLGLVAQERAAIRKVLDDMVRERAAGGKSAQLSNPVNIGIGIAA